MKRVDLIRHIEASGCVFLREGGRHMVSKICRELEIDEPGKEKKSAKVEPSDAADSR